MKKRLFAILGFAIIGALAVTLVSDSQAGLRERFSGKAKNHEAGIKMAAGVYSGALRGEIRLQDQKVMITDKTVLYVIGQGVRKDRSMVVTQRPVSARGTMVGGVLVADIVMIRPVPSHTAVPAASTRVTPSDSNPDVGIVEVGAED